MTTNKAMLDDLRTSRLWAVVREYSHGLIQEPIPKKKGKAQQQASRSYLPHEQYTLRCCLSIWELFSICEQMAIATELLSGYRETAQTRRASITRRDYIVYHLENYLIRATSVLDRSLQLANVVFDLGLAEIDCKKDTMCRHEHVKPACVPAAIKTLDKLLERLRKDRNVVIHRRQYSEKGFEDFEIYYVIQKDNMQQGTEDSLIKDGFAFFKSATDKFVRGKKREYSDYNKKIFSAVKQVLDVLEPPFVARRKVLELLTNSTI